MTKKKYASLRISRVTVTPDNPILIGSIISDKTITVTEQQVGKVYDFSEKPIGEDAGKYFNHEWE